MSTTIAIVSYTKLDWFGKINSSLPFFSQPNSHSPRKVWNRPFNNEFSFLIKPLKKTL